MRKTLESPASSEQLDFRTDTEKRADEEKVKAKLVEIIRRNTREHLTTTNFPPELNTIAEKLLKEEKESNQRDEIYKHPRKSWRA